MADVLDQAQNFSGGPVAAARKRERWLMKAANSSDEQTAARYREAAADLAARYPDIADLDPGEAEAFARDRGHGSGSRSPVHEGRSRARPGSRRSSTSAPAKKPKAAKRAAAKGRKPRRSSRRRSTPTPRVDRAIRQTGIPAQVESGASTTMLLLGGTISLSLLYLLLSSAESSGIRGKAFPQLIDAIVGAVGRFLEPRDFFSHPKLESTARVVPGAAPVRSRAPHRKIARVEAGRNPRREGIEEGRLSNPAAELMP